MATNPKLMPCPNCASDEYLTVYAYDDGARHVECNKCFYLGPAEGSVVANPDDDLDDDFDPDGEFDRGEECGRWINGRLSRQCLLAGTEWCDFECPYR